MEGMVHNAITDSSDSTRSTAGSDSSTGSLSFTNSLPPSRYFKFERYSKQLINIGREVLAKDHSYDRRGQHFLNVDRYLRIHDKMCTWIRCHDNAVLFADSDAFFYLAQMAVAMQTIEIALALRHQPVRWPGATPGPSLCWPGVEMQEVYRRFDEMIFDGRELDTETLPWNG